MENHLYKEIETQVIEHVEGSRLWVIEWRPKNKFLTWWGLNPWKTFNQVLEAQGILDYAQPVFFDDYMEAMRKSKKLRNVEVLLEHYRQQDHIYREAVDRLSRVKKILRNSKTGDRS